MDKPKHTEPTLERILSVLKPMGDLIVQDEAGAQGIHKDNILFCLVNGNDVYLNNVEVGGPYYFHKGLRLPFRKVENIHTILTPTVFKDSILVTDLMRVYQYGFGN